MVTINIGKKEMVFFSVVILVFAVVGLSVAIGSGDYTVHGHDAGEIEGGGSGEGVVRTGVLNHGDIIPIPGGYVESDCKWIVSLENIQAVGTVNSDDTLGVWVGPDRMVHVGDWDNSANYKTVEPGDTTGDVNYMIICGGVPAVGADSGVVIGEYTGDGASSQAINLGFEPSLLLLTRQDTSQGHCSGTCIKSPLMSQTKQMADGSSWDDITLTATGFSVDLELNNNGGLFHYSAWR